MTTTLQVSRGLCSPMRGDVLTALEPFGVKILAFDCWGEGHYHLPIPDSMRMPDSDIWVKKHRAVITVSDDQAKWAERLLWQSGKVWLDSPPLNPALNWTAPAECKAGEHGTLGRGKMPTPWSEKARQASGIFGGLFSMFQDAPAPPRRQRRQQRKRRGTR